MPFQQPIRLPDDEEQQGSSRSAPQVERVNKYETQLPIRLDIEAALCYALGGFTGLAFLILETKNDYVN